MRSTKCIPPSVSDRAEIHVLVPWQTKGWPQQDYVCQVPKTSRVLEDNGLAIIGEV